MNYIIIYIHKAITTIIKITMDVPIVDNNFLVQLTLGLERVRKNVINIPTVKLIVKTTIKNRKAKTPNIYNIGIRFLSRQFYCTDFLSDQRYTNSFNGSVRSRDWQC